MKYFVCLLLLTSFGFNQLTAQRYGHANFTTILAEMPGTKAAERELEAYNASLVSQREEMITKFQDAVRDAEAKQPTMAPIEFNKLREGLETQQASIQQFEQQIGQKLEGKRQELLGPLIKILKDTIAEVAKENGFALVFDTSVFNAVLFAAESEDMETMIRTKLGL